MDPLAQLLGRVTRPTAPPATPQALPKPVPRTAGLTGATPPSAPTLSPAEVRAQQRTQLLDAARELLTQQGFEETTLQQVAERAQVPSSRILDHCLGREDLFFQVLTREVETLAAIGRQIISPNIPVMGLLAALSERAFGHITQNRLLLQLLVGSVAEAMPEWQERLDDLIRRLQKVAVDALKIGIEQRVLREDLPLDLVAGYLIESHVAGYLLHHRPGPEAQLRASQRRLAVLEILFNGLRRREVYDE